MKEETPSDVIKRLAEEYFQSLCITQKARTYPVKGFIAGYEKCLFALKENLRQSFEAAREKYIDPISEDADRDRKYETFEDYFDSLLK